ncbi:stage VI sporulation protein F [Geomicrobium sp. JCM 19038]|uniref:stage VI sporulation protein F n=1 Tax=Geomicrobium sp. JCM 19038 TaxID=1460635 RepID=UPI00045F43CB|nr:stage VI sporulation protein F [Geomicrobium sp. JCM 19038]GAK06639.1 hypothetical protein JCM19038_342 [Geomicrobium sp. JCM 19038]
MNNFDSIFDRLNKESKVNQDDVFNMANSVSGANFQDEATVRQLINDVARMAGVRVSREKEDQLVHAITNNEMPLDFQSLSQLFRG